MRQLEYNRFHQLKRIVLALSGAHEEVLELVPSERGRFESLGWAILITSGVAMVSMWFALASAVGINGFLAFPVALAWGLVIMGIDRWLIVSMPADGSRKIAMAVPRFALALLLGTLISTPLVLRVFQSEINAQVAKMQQQTYSTFLQQQQASDVSKQVGTYSSELQYLNNVIATHGAATANTTADPELVTYNKQLTSLNSELTHWTSLKNQYYTDYTCQLYGGATCPKKGDGPAAKDSLQNYENASQEVSTLTGQINSVHKEIQQRDAQLSSNSTADEQARYQQALAQQPTVKNEYQTALQRQDQLQASFYASNQASHGILIRLEALSQLSNGNFTVTAARFLLFLLFLVIECLPVTVKLMQRPGLYEEALAYARESERRDASKFYQFRSRLAGPTGTAMLRPMLWTETDRRIEEIWSPQKALPGSVIAQDDQPTQAVPEADPWAPGARPGNDRPGNDRPRDDRPGNDRPGNDRPGNNRPGGERPERRWHGAKRWRNNWPDTFPAAEEPPAETAGPGASSPGASSRGASSRGASPRGASPRGASPREARGPADPEPGIGVPAPWSEREQVPDRGWLPDEPADEPTDEPADDLAADPAPGIYVRQQQDSLAATYDTGGYRVRDRDEDRDEDRRDDAAGAPKPGNGGTPLSWDEDE
jgi:hypothetical protein